MKHPALTSALSVFLTVLCVVQLFAGIFGFRSAEEDREKNINSYKRIESRLEKYREVQQELQDNDLDYDSASESLVSGQEQHAHDSSEHRTALSIYTATRSGEIQGADALWAAKAAMPEAWRQLEQGEAAYLEQAAAFNQQYEQYMQMKPVLDAAMPAIDSVLSNSENARNLIASIVETEEISDEQYEMANNAFLAALNAIDAFQASDVYEAIAARAAESGIDISAVFEQVKSAKDENGNLSRDEANRIAGEISDAILDGFDQAVNGLSQIKMIRDNEAALIAGKEAIDQAGAAIEEGKRQLMMGEQMIQSSLELLWHELGKLDDQKIDLEEERERLMKENEELQALEAEVKYYEDLTKRVKGARNLLLYYEDVRNAHDSGMEIEEAAEFVISEKKAAAENEYAVRRVFCYAAIVAAVIGILSMFGAFEIIKIRNFVFITAILCGIISLGAEAYYRTLDIDSIYITLIMPIFAFIQALTVLPQKKKSI